MGKRQELEMEAIRRYADGMEIPAISAELCVSENSLRTWKKRAGSEWDDARKSARQIRLADMEDVGARLRRSREIANQLTGSSKHQSEFGLILNQSLQTAIYDLIGQIQTLDIADDGELAAAIERINTLTLSVGRLEQSASRNQKTAADIRKQALEQAAEVVQETARKGGLGLSDEAANEIRRKILGIGA